LGDFNVTIQNDVNGIEMSPIEHQMCISELFNYLGGCMGFCFLKGEGAQERRNVIKTNVLVNCLTIWVGVEDFIFIFFDEGEVRVFFFLFFFVTFLFLKGEGGHGVFSLFVIFLYY
jgi:hypothetical protein